MHLPDLDITIASVKDAALIATLGAATFTETFAAYNTQEDMGRYVAEEMNEAKIAEELLDTANEFFIVWKAGLPAGYAKIRPGTLPDGLISEKPMELERLYILQAYQGIKAGSALMAHYLQLARSRGCDTAWLGVWEHNHKAIAFYEKWGFTFFGSHLFMVGADEQTDLLMKLDL